MEAIVPVTFMLIFTMAYYGPNAEIIGNVKFNQWHFKAITDLEQYVSNLALLFIVDLSSAMISGVILWTTCKINIFKTLQKIQKDLWYFWAIYDTYKFMNVSNTIIVTNTILLYDYLHLYTIVLLSSNCGSWS